MRGVTLGRWVNFLRYRVRVIDANSIGSVCSRDAYPSPGPLFASARTELLSGEWSCYLIQHV